MIIKKTRNVRFNLGHYEHFETFATIQVDTDSERDRNDLEEIGIDPLDFSAIEEFIDHRLLEFASSDADLVAKITDADDSAVFPYIDATTTRGKRK